MEGMAVIPAEHYGNFCATIRHWLDLPETQKITSGEAYGMLLGAFAEADKHRIEAEWLLTDGEKEEFVTDFETLRQYCFAYMNSGPIVAKFPRMKAVPGSLFNTNTAIKKAFFSNANTMAGYVFNGATALEFADIGNTAGITTATFRNASSLKEIVIRRTITPASLYTITALQGSPFAEGGAGGKIYVPAALIESYKTAANWSALVGYGTCEFLPLEGSEYE